MLRVAAICVLAAAAWGQLPGPTTPGPLPGGSQYPRVPQNPFPPGTQPYPGPGTGPQYPGGGGVPPIIIDANRLPGTRGSKGDPPPNVQVSAPRNIEVTEGILRESDAKHITVEADDHRVISYRLSGDIQVTKGTATAAVSDFTLGDHVRVESISDDAGNYTAVGVTWLASGTDEERRAAADRWDLPPTVVREEDKNQRPVIRRGRPEPKPERPAPVTETAEAPERPAPESPAPPDAVLDRVRAEAGEFLTILPSFTVRQLTTRYVKEFARNDWRALDLVSARVTYRGGKEDYSEVTVGNKPVNSKLEDVDGLRTTGEFSSMLEEVLNPLSGTVFVRSGQDQIRGRRAWKYSYSAPRDRSRWRVFAPSEVYYPAYRGVLWIDVETSRVLRLETEATGLPERFPFDAVEVTVDYDFVRLDASKQFLLPVAADALYCVRSTSQCRKNHTEFRNYVKFDAESTFVPDVN